MSTRCRIGMLNEDKSVTSVACHWDGMPDVAGETLYRSWDESGKVESLVEGGDISELGDGLDETSYHLNEGDEGCPSITHAMSEWPDSGQEWEYLFNPRSETWSVRSEDSGWESLSSILSEGDEDDDEEGEDDWDDDDFEDDEGDGWEED